MKRNRLSLYGNNIMTAAAIYMCLKSTTTRRSVSAFSLLGQPPPPKYQTIHTISQQSPHLFSTRTSSSSSPKTRTSTTFLQSTTSPPQAPMKINLLTLPLDELTTLIQSWKQPTFRAKQVHHWIREKGVTSFDEMTNLPKALLTLLEQHATLTSTHLHLAEEQISKDGTIKRAYQLNDGQIIESVLMPYENKQGRNTACISSQAGCAMGCVFCATGQMGFARQLTADEIFEQVARFASELKSRNERLSNVVMMGMGEPLANYRNVMEAISRMNSELGIGARKITVSTVGIVPNIRKLIDDPMQVRLAISLHCATEEERSALLPANRRYGGLDELMLAVKDYTETTKRRITLEWALIENQNDTPEVARQLGKLLKRFALRMDLIHINLIPLNPTGGFVNGRPSQKSRVDQFVHILGHEFGVSATPRMRRGIDIDAGCGQLKSKVKKKEEQETAEQELKLQNQQEEEEEYQLQDFIQAPPTVGVYEDDGDYDDYDDNDDETMDISNPFEPQRSISEQTICLDTEEDFEDEEYQTEAELQEANRLLQLVQSSFSAPLKSNTNTFTEEESEKSTTTTTTSITDEDSVREAKRRRKKLLKNLKMIRKLVEKEEAGFELNEEQRIKIGREQEWRAELESVEHNLQ